MKAEAIIFDLDGTMWDAVGGILLTWNQVVSNHPECRKEPISPEELSGCLGLPMTEIGARLFPDVPQEKQQMLLDECCALENQYLSEHGGILYPKLEKTLLALKRTISFLWSATAKRGMLRALSKRTGLKSVLTISSAGGITFCRRVRIISLL